MSAAARRSTRLRSRPDHASPSTFQATLNDGIHNAAVRKRQRRLTAAQRLVNHLKPNIVAAEDVQAAAEAEEEDDKKVVEETIDDDESPPESSKDHHREKIEDCTSSEEEDSWGSDESSIGDEAPSSYETTGPSVKLAPGKRIKWRNAILESDLVRQNLSCRFLRVFLE